MSEADNIINTRTVARRFAISDDIVLATTSKTRTVFRPNLHEGGVRGHIVRQKVGPEGVWLEVNDADFRTLPPDSGVQIELDTAATSLMYEKLTQLYEVNKRGIDSGEHQYVVGEVDQVLIVNDRSRAEVIQQLLDCGYSEVVWNELARQDPGLATRLAAARIQLDRETSVREFENSLADHASDEAYWQGFFESHPWMLESVFSAAVFMLGGETYVGGKRPRGRQGVGGVATDFLFSDDSTKSFAVIEIKTPDAKLVGPAYRGAGGNLDNDIFSMHNDLSGAVVQVRNQIAVAVEQFESVLGPGFRDKINRVHPKGVVITGCKDGLSTRQVDSFNLFRHSLYSLTLITFDELLKRLQLLLGLAEPSDLSPTDIDDASW